MDAGASAKGGRSSIQWRFALVLAALGATHAAWAQDVPLGAAAAEVPPLPPRLEVASTSLPRFDGLDAAGNSQRLDLTLLPPRRWLH